MESFAGWTLEAISLVERSIAAHGGLERWQSTTNLRLPLRSASGALLALKGYPRTFPAPREFEVFPHECITVFHEYPSQGQRGCFAAGDVRIESADARLPLLGGI